MFVAHHQFILTLALLSTQMMANATALAETAGSAGAAMQGAATTPSLSQAEAVRMILRRAGEDADSGVVTNQVVTVAGQDFFQYFVSAWRDKEGSERYTLAVRERPSARSGSEVWVEYAQGQVFRTRLPNSRAALRQLGDDAAEISYQAVLQANSRRQVSNDADIAIDEF
jgi:curli production assembly/transport component CsgE